VDARPVWSGFAAGQRINLAHYTSLPGADISAADATLLSGAILSDAL
jgi:hypothetical protein